MAELMDYEKLREENIRRNKELLSRLGLAQQIVSELPLNIISVIKGSEFKVSTKKRFEAQQKLSKPLIKPKDRRRSGRLQGKDAIVYTDSALVLLLPFDAAKLLIP